MGNCRVTLLENRLRDVQRLVAAVVNICVVAGEQRTLKVHGNVRGYILQYHSGSVIQELVVVEAGMGYTAPGAVEVESYLVFLKAAGNGIYPGIAIAQHGSFPAAEQADHGPLCDHSHRTGAWRIA